MIKKLEIGKTAFTIIALNIVQLAAISLIAIYLISNGYYFRLDNESLLMLIIISTVILNTFLTIMSVYPMIGANSQNRLLQDALLNLENMNNTLRAQRHDFLNHLQVVFGLIELDDYKDARDYIENVYGDIQSVSNVLKTSLPAVNALIQAKFNTCEKLGITATLNATSQLKDLPIPSWEMCRILGNLIDNAIFALKDQSGEKLLEINLYEDLRSFGFRVKDNGLCIKKELLEKIFESGFSTKGSEGEGMGLSITKDLIETYNGTINVSSDEIETVFEGSIPKLDQIHV